MCRGLPNRRSIWAAEGTAAHKLGDRCLVDGSDADEHLGEKIYVEDFPEPFIVDEEMASAVQVYLDHIRAIDKRPHATGDDLEWIEDKVSLSAFANGEDDVLHEMFGTADYIRYIKRDRTLVVVDYKHGAGVKVDAEDNAQGRYYALGALAQLSRGRKVDKIEVHIVQPRADEDNPISIEVVDVVDLLDWSVDLFTAARRTTDPNAPLKAGKHCRFCSAQAVCPENQNTRVAEAKLIFKEGVFVPAQPVERLTLDDLRAVLDSADGITAWINAAQKLAHDMIEGGQHVPGYKIVAKRATRKWRDDQVTADWLCKNYGLGDDDIYVEPKVKSPAQIEKLLDKEGKKALAGSDLVVAESSGNTLAPESDKRPAVAGRTPPAEVFTPV
jgi:hypothetical protein